MSNSRAVIDLSIIIPTLNEEHFIGRLLDSIIRQTVKPKEIVIVDAYSKDKTVQEIKNRQVNIANLKYFQIPKSTIARQRNFGADKTTSPHLLFLDADMELKEEDVLERYFKEVSKRRPDVAAAPNLPDAKYWKDLIYFKAENLLIKLLKYFWPVMTARNLYVRREIFDHIGRFDEEIPVGEDHDLVQRIVKKGGRSMILKTVNLYTSTRRIELEGRRKYALKIILFGLNIMLRGHKKSRIKYEFGNFKQPDSSLLRQKSV